MKIFEIQATNKHKTLEEALAAAEEGGILKVPQDALFQLTLVCGFR